mmetsp:Transcript_25640/g.65150  ORF Transcript_25640/g.65150 Transcript_25640/m.65150 type:complete len:242 (-) Transcript_25640:852-1577(-)
MDGSRAPKVSLELVKFDIDMQDMREQGDDAVRTWCWLPARGPMEASPRLEMSGIALIGMRQAAANATLTSHSSSSSIDCERLREALEAPEPRDLTHLASVTDDELHQFVIINLAEVDALLAPTQLIRRGQWEQCAREYPVERWRRLVELAQVGVIAVVFELSHLRDGAVGEDLEVIERGSRSGANGGPHVDSTRARIRYGVVDHERVDVVLVARHARGGRCGHRHPSVRSRGLGHLGDDAH